MGPIIQHIRPHDVFDSATLTLLAEAYDKYREPRPALTVQWLRRFIHRICNRASSVRAKYSQ